MPYPQTVYAEGGELVVRDLNPNKPTVQGMLLHAIWKMGREPCNATCAYCKALARFEDAFDRRHGLLE